MITVKKLLTASLLLLIFTVPSFALNGDERTITVNGTGIIRTAPDTASIRLGVDSQGKRAQEAQSENAAAMQKVIDELKKLGIAKDDIRTDNFNLWPDMRYEQNQPPKLAGYHCSNQVSVNNIEDFSEISKIIDSGIAAGANNVMGIQFSKKNDLDARKQALAEAVKEAEAKAEAIAAAAGIKIKGIKNIVEGWASVRPLMTNELVLKAAAVPQTETPVNAGMVEVSGNVTRSL